MKRSLFLCIGFILLSSCSNNEEEKSSNEPVVADTCERVTEENIISILGESPEAEKKSGFGVKGCQWTVEVDSQEFISDNKVSFHTGSSATYAAALDSLRPDGEVVEDLGDEAFVVPGFSSATGGGTRGSSLYIVNGDDVLVVSAVFEGDAVETEKLSAIAEELL